MESILSHLQVLYPQLHYRIGKTFYWSPETKEVFYTTTSNNPTAVCSLLHEVSHALLEHTSYKRDIELLQMEVAAWERAKALAAELGQAIDDEHIQDCLDTYRDWLDCRSACPNCTHKGIQEEPRQYRCFNCHAVWKVTPARFVRTYRANTSQRAALAFHDMPEL